MYGYDFFNIFAYISATITLEEEFFCGQTFANSKTSEI